MPNILREKTNNFTRALSQVYSEYFAPNSYKNTITIAPVLLHPRSEGEVKLSSANSFDPPLIDPKYLSNQDDIAVLTDGIAFDSIIVLQQLSTTAGISNIFRRYARRIKFI